MNNNIDFDSLTNNSQMPPQRKRGNGFAIASMVLGIVSVLCCCLKFVPLITGALAIVFFVVDYRQNSKANGMAIAGLICGIVGALLGVCTVLSDLFFGQSYEEWESIMNSIINQSQPTNTDTRIY